jgi:hypothetical protein
MNYLKSLLRPIWRSRYGIRLRNKIGFRPAKIMFPNLSNYSSSDAFPWRTDSGYVTYFRFGDTPKIYYGIEGAKVRFLFFDRSGHVVKEFELDKVPASHELVIDKEFLNNLEDYGTFSVFHVFDDKDCSGVKITNRCYVGFSQNNGLPSFVHGNIHARYWNPQTDKIMSDMVLMAGKPITYVLQKNFITCDCVELFFANPTTHRVWATVNDQKIFLNSGESKFIHIEPTNLVRIVSNCYFLRPLIFTINNEFIDCLHA